MRAALRAAFYAPGDWLARAMDARQRRAAAAWILVLLVATTPLRAPFRDRVSLVWAISEVALWLAMWGVVAAETPVEAEGDRADT